MKSLGLSIVTATFAGFLWSTPSLAQSTAEIQAGALRQTADRLAESNADIDQLSAAYNRALNAYSALGDTQTSLAILRKLYDLNYFQCRDDEAIVWAKDAISRLTQSAGNLDLKRTLNFYSFWVQSLGELYEDRNQNSDAVALYRTGVSYMTIQPQSTRGILSLNPESKFLLRLLNLQASDSTAVERLEQQLIAAQQRAGAVTQVFNLLTDARYLQGQGNSSSAILLAALQTSQQHNYQAGELYASLLLGKQALQLENFSRASVYGRRAMAIAGDLIDGESEQYNALYILAQAEQGSGNPLVAIEHYTTLLARLNSEPPLYIEANKAVVVRNLVTLYQQTNQVALATSLEQDYADLLAPGVFVPRRNLLSTRTNLRTTAPITLFRRPGTCRRSLNRPDVSPIPPMLIINP